MVILGIISGLLVLSLLVTVHELGHAWAARRNGVAVEEFAIGFPPTLWSKVLKSGIRFKLNALLMGGYVKLQGEHDAADQLGDYGRATWWAKTKILFAGIAMNYLLAALVLSILAIFGLPKILDKQVSLPGDQTITSPVIVQALEASGPAEQAGLRVGDQLVSIQQQIIVSPTDLRQVTKQLAGQTVEVKLKRQDRELSINLLVRGHDKTVDQGYVGIIPAQNITIKTAWYKAPLLGFLTTGQLAGETFKSLGQLLNNLFSGLAQKLSHDPLTQQRGGANLSKASQSVAGPVQLLAIIFPALLSTDGTTFLLFVALISLTLAVMNSLPIPGLDGGRWLLSTIFRLFKRPLTKEHEQAINGAGMLLLIVLSLIVLVSDVVKIF